MGRRRSRASCPRGALAALLLAACLLLSAAPAPTGAQDTPPVTIAGQGLLTEDKQAAALLAAAGADPSTSGYVTSTSTDRPARVPLAVLRAAQERSSEPAAKPAGLAALTFDQLAAAYSGASAPGASGSGNKFGPVSPAGAGITPLANGNGGASFADSRFGLNGADYVANSKLVGKLWSRFGGTWYVCTATTIGKSLLLTAAHCVFKYGKGAAGWPDKDASGNYQVFFRPNYNQGTAPFGDFWAQGLMVPTPYVSGTDTCQTSGVTCNNDMALIWVKTVSGQLIHQRVGGWMGYAWNGFGWASPLGSYGFSGPAYAAITQFGYPQAFDGGERMQISNSPSYQTTATGGNGKQLKMIIKGTSMTGGSSGGPWIVNYGIDATPSSGNGYGQQTTRNVLVGVTSWGYTDVGIKVQGASFFGVNNEFPSTYGTRGAGNIAKLIFDACDNAAVAGWSLQSKGFCT